jgi:Glu-tRNA(Gln) amidotransferase subunit E-like FAD-binding protein
MKKTKIRKEKSSNSIFCRLIEKRVRRYTRMNKIFKKNDKILVTDDLDEYFVKSITKKLPVKIYKKQVKNVRLMIIKLWTADDEINLFLKQMFYGKKIKEEKFVKLLKVITNEEAAKFAKIKGLKFKPNKQDKLVKDFIDEMTSKYPDTKHKLIKSIELTKGL